MSNVLNNEKQQQVLALGRLGWSLRKIEQATGVRRETASAYLKAAGIAVRLPGGRAAKPATKVATDSSSPAKPATKVATDSSAAFAESAQPPSTAVPAVSSEQEKSKPREKGSSGSTIPGSILHPGRTDSRTLSVCEPYREVIELGLSRGRNATAIWQDLVSEHGFPHQYGSVKRWVRKQRGQQTPAAIPIIVTAPGEEAQVDYGTGPGVRDPQSGKYRRTRLFVMTLGYSRKSVRLLTFRSNSRTWAELHEQAFRRLGGSVRIIVLDNLREGVLVPDVHDPSLNPLYRDVLAHYGAVALPCRVRHPDRKGKVEAAVGHAQKTPLKGLRFETLEQAQTYLDRWEAHWADTRIHGTTKRQVAAMFAEEKPSLLPLPLEPFRYYQYGTRSVHLDGCVEVEAAYYSTPPGWIGRQVQVQWDTLFVRILDPRTGQLLREHVHQRRGGHRLRDEDRSPRTPLRLQQLLHRAHQAGSRIGTLCQLIYEKQSDYGVRRILGVLALTKRYGIAAVDDACAAALEIGVPEYRFVRRYLERQPPLQLSLQQVDPLIRELVHYRDLINHKTKE
jgi:transposase